MERYTSYLPSRPHSRPHFVASRRPVLCATTWGIFVLLVLSLSEFDVVSARFYDFRSVHSFRDRYLSARPRSNENIHSQDAASGIGMKTSSSPFAAAAAQSGISAMPAFLTDKYRLVWKQHVLRKCGGGPNAMLARIAQESGIGLDMLFLAIASKPELRDTYLALAQNYIDCWKKVKAQQNLLLLGY